MQYISSIQVMYGDEPSEAPSNRVLEINGQSNNINSDFGGKYVWLVPTFTTNKDAALTGFDVAIQAAADPRLAMHDLAKGAAGAYRYLICDQTAAKTGKVTEVALLRIAQELVDRPDEWDGNTENINKGRGGTYLYLLWKTKVAA